MIYKTLCKTGRGGRIRTADPLLPKQMRYQAALHPDLCEHNRKTPVKSTVLAEKVTG